MPFTSTPFIYKVLIKPSFYIDSFVCISKNDMGTLGEENIIGLSQLISRVLRQVNF